MAVPCRGSSELGSSENCIVFMCRVFCAGARWVNLNLGTEGKGIAQVEGLERRPVAMQSTIIRISHAMPVPIVAAFAATAWIGSGLRLSGRSTKASPNRHACRSSRRRGSAAISSELESWARAIINVGTVRTMRRPRPRFANSSSMKPLPRSRRTSR